MQDPSDECGASHTDEGLMDRRHVGEGALTARLTS